MRKIIFIIATALSMTSSYAAECKKINPQNAESGIRKILSNTDIKLTSFLRITQNSDEAKAYIVVDGNTGYINGDGSNSMKARANISCYSGVWKVESIRWGQYRDDPYGNKGFSFDKNPINLY